jgi:HK97 family phage major capsid protein
MAITAPTLRSDFSGFLPPEMSAPIFEKAARQSVVMQLVPQVPLGPEGKNIPIVTGRPVANWVAEGARKPATKGTLDLKLITPKKLAAIVVVADEVIRANPGNYVSSLREQLAQAFAVAFDLATLHNLGGDGTGTGPFTTWIDQTTKSVELGGNSQANGGVWKDFVDALEEVVSSKDSTGRRRRVTGWALDDIVEPRLLGSVDSTGRPLWVDLPANQEANALSRPGSLMGRRSFMGEGVADANDHIVGYGGDWSQAAWGVVGGISYGVTNVGAVTINGTLTSTWENNLTAIKAEAEYGFLVNDKDSFVQLRNDIGS